MPDSIPACCVLRQSMLDIFELTYQPSSETLFAQLNILPNCIWLDSGKPDSDLGRYDIFSALPSRQVSSADTDMLAQINTALVQSEMESTLPFCGGWLGYFAYDFQHTRHKIPLRTNNAFLSAWFGWYDWAVIVDHKHQHTIVFFSEGCPAATRHRVEHHLQQPPPPAKPFYCGPFQANESKAQYLAAINKIQAYLCAGDCYQVNYAQRFSANFTGCAKAAYSQLRQAVPSPFGAFLDTPSGAILSISPERFIAVDQRSAISQPIKGTAPRGAEEIEDQWLLKQLKTSKKNLAENVMIVDLLRNDFSQHCLPHSVQVPKLFEIQSFTNVHHLVSTVTGTLRNNVSHSEFLLACFPGGSITGAPKKRAMEIIDELERCPRGPYCGSIGYFSRNGSSDFNIAIRTLQQQSTTMLAWAGGGIVYDSEPEQEYEESLQKISKLLRALESA